MLTLTVFALAGLALSPVVSADLNNITLVQLWGCESFPGYDSSTDIAGPFTFAADSTGTVIDGNSDSATYVRSETELAYGYLTIPVNTTLPAAATPIRCTNNTIQGKVPTGVSSTTWQPLVAEASTPDDAEFGYMLSGDNLPIRPFAHVVDGVQQADIFLGAEGTSTWAFAYHSDVLFGDYFSIRLLGPETAGALNEGEFAGFLKVSS